MAGKIATFVESRRGSGPRGGVRRRQAGKAMTRDTRFWMSLAVFQIVFGLAVFAITRDYYMQDAATVSAHPSLTGGPAPVLSQGITAAEISRLTSPAPAMTTTDDPVAIYRQAEEFFANGQYAQAAHLYEQLLVLSPGDAELHNNLGLTLFYLGRAEESLRTLNDGVAADPQHQRIWLTLGYVNSQLGNTELARSALENAVQLGNDESIRESARRMLAELR